MSAPLMLQAFRGSPIAHGPFHLEGTLLSVISFPPDHARSIFGESKPHSRYLRCALMFCCRLFSGSRRTGFRSCFPMLSLRAFSSVVSRGIVYIAFVVWILGVDGRMDEVGWVRRLMGEVRSKTTPKDVVG
jgi:hypothetical protein